MATMKCKQCGTEKDVVRYGKGLKYEGVPIPQGPQCHGCIRAFKKDVDHFVSTADLPRSESAAGQEKKP